MDRPPEYTWEEWFDRWQCSNCVFYLSLTKVNGECRRYPPVEDRKYTSGSWPNVRVGDNCGEFINDKDLK